MSNQDKAENAIKWINGLLKTKDKQGKEQLGDSSSGYCCLGYGCKVLGLNYNPLQGTSKSFGESVGLLKASGYFGESKEFAVKNLTEINDELGYSFKKIAKFIKANANELFEDDVAKQIINHYQKEIKS
jgi:hypothetical protein